MIDSAMAITAHIALIAFNIVSVLNVAADTVPLRPAAAAPACGDGNYCPTCPKGRANYDTIHLMVRHNTAGLQQLHGSAALALTTFATFGALRSSDLKDAHMTVQYLCCMSPAQLLKATAVLEARRFPPLRVRFDGGVICDTASFIVLADNATQTALGAWVQGTEEALLAAGVPVSIRRAQQAPFHSTLGTMGWNATTTVAAMAAVNKALPSFNAAPINVSSAALLPSGRKCYNFPKCVAWRDWAWRDPSWV